MGVGGFVVEDVGGQGGTHHLIHGGNSRHFLQLHRILSHILKMSDTGAHIIFCLRVIDAVTCYTNDDAGAGQNSYTNY